MGSRRRGGPVVLEGRRVHPAGRVGAVPQLTGALFSLAVAVALFTRFGIEGYLSRDEAIYAYGGLQLAAHGTPPYLSIFDPKAPVATLVCGAAAMLAEAVGRNPLLAMRAAFFVCACLTVLAVYLLATRVWRSAVAGVVAAVVFASFDGFARDALSGPDAKVPGILAAVVAMWLLLRRHWFLGALFGSLAVLDWQPLVSYPLVAVLLALHCSLMRRRVRPVVEGVLGALLPPVVTAAGFAAFGAFRPLVESTVLFPLFGVERGHATFLGHVRRIAEVVGHDYHLSGRLFWAGILALVVLLPLLPLLARRVPARLARGAGPDRAGPAPRLVLAVVGVTFLFDVAYALYDFQGYPDLYPLLPYAALGLGGAVGLLAGAFRHAAVRGAATAVVLVAALVLTSYSWNWFSTGPDHQPTLPQQQADARVLDRVLGHSGRLLALGTPQPLVLTARRNPDRFIYLGSGVAAWKVAHIPGGFHGWTRQVARTRPDVVAIRTWHGTLHQRMTTWLRAAGYQKGRLGLWQLYLTPAAKQRIHAIREGGR